MHPKVEFGDDTTDLGTKNRSSELRKRGRPPKTEAVDLSRRIVAAASRQFLASGYQATSMDAIAAETGSSKRTLYARFPSKLHLFEAAITQHSFLTEGELERFDSHSGSVAVALEEFAVWLSRRTANARNVAFFRILAAEAHRNVELQEFNERHIVQPIVRTVARIFERGMQSGEIAEAMPTFLAEQFLEVACGQEMRRRIYGQICGQETKGSRERMRGIIQLFLKGAEGR